MEKFTTYRDKGTGISPFMPVSPPDADDAFKTYILKPATFIIKLPFFLISSLILTLSSIIFPAALFKVLVRWYIYTFFNISSVEYLADGVRKSNKKAIDACRPQEKDTVLVNFSSPLDPWVLYLISNSRRAEFYSVDSHGNLFKVGGPFDASIFAVSHPCISADSNSVCKTVDSNEKAANFVFVEGTTTNNRSIMPFPKGFDPSKISGNAECKVVSLKLHPTSCLTTPIPQSPILFVYQNLSQIHLNGRYKLKSFLMKHSDLVEAKIRESLSNYGKLKLLGEYLDLEKKAEFIAERTSKLGGGRRKRD